MSRLKELMSEIEDVEDQSDDGIEVYADSIREALDLAAEELDVDITVLDYEVLAKGTRGFFGFGRQPYHILVRQVIETAEHDDLDELERKLAGEHVPGVSVPAKKKDEDGNFKVRVTRSGVMVTVNPPRGKGKKADLNDITNKLYSMRITNPDMKVLQKEADKPSGSPTKIAEWTPNPDLDSSLRVEMAEDEMHAYVHFTPPRYNGRHLDVDEVLNALKNYGIVAGIKEDRIREYLDEMDYTSPLVAAEGTKAHHGKDAYIDYKVRVDQNSVNFEEDESGRVDFKDLDLIENVVVGQVLAVKVPAEEGVPGRTVTNQVLPAKSGKDTKVQHGKGTILSEDGRELTAEINGQVVYKGGKISVEPVFVVNGDVSLDTGDIVFLGSVVVSGSVQDNFSVKAAGNIEVKGTVQKAILEAEGDVLVRQGIMGREEGRVESTGGSVYAKFIQNANIVAEKNVIVPEGIIHSNIDAGEGIFSIGRRARIVGGRIRAGDEVNARFIGAEGSTNMEVKVGINPKLLQQIEDITKRREKNNEEIEGMSLNLKTLQTQNKTTRLSEEKLQRLEELESQHEKLTKRNEELDAELKELEQYINMLEQKGKICAEKTCYPGVHLWVKDKDFQVKDEYHNIKFAMEGGEIRLSEYEKPDLGEETQRMAAGQRMR